jgi:hypothetical protein
MGPTIKDLPDISWKHVLKEKSEDMIHVLQFPYNGEPPRVSPNPSSKQHRLTATETSSPGTLPFSKLTWLASDATRRKSQTTPTSLSATTAASPRSTLPSTSSTSRVSSRRPSASLLPNCRTSPSSHGSRPSSHCSALARVALSRSTSTPATAMR